MLGKIKRYGEITVDTRLGVAVEFDWQRCETENEFLDIKDVKELIDQLSAWVGIQEA